jgi:AcrR family transcriptional regulator
MPATGLRERKREKTRDALAQSALRLFAERGFDRVTVEEIAAAHDLSARTFFRYFASKEDVLFSEGDRRRTHLLAALADQDPSVRPFPALEAALRLVATDYAQERDLLRLRHQIISSTPSLSTRAAERRQGWEGEALEQLRTSGRADSMSDLELRLVVAATTTALQVAIEAWVLSDEAKLDTILDEVFTQLRNGLGR